MMTQFQPGDRVELVATTDPLTKLRPGDRGRVSRFSEQPYDVVGPAVYVLWDDGSNLTILPDEGDVIRKVALGA